MKYLSIVVLSLAVLNAGSSTLQSEHTVSTTETPHVETTAWNPPALSTPVAVPQKQVVTAKAILAKESSPVLPGEAQWDTQSTDSTAYWPSEASPMASLPVSAQVTFACIRYHESRNHLTSVNAYSGDAGLYQFAYFIWKAFGGLQYAPTPQQATGIEQDQVAVNVYDKNHGFYPEWAGDAC